MASASTSAVPPPPPPIPVIEKRTVTQLKAHFASLSLDHAEIQTLFRAIANQLESVENIGPHHPLYERWDRLRQAHRNLLLRHEADRPSDFDEVVLPTSQSNGMSIEDKRSMIDGFREAIQVHQEAAQQTAHEFHQLAEDIRSFKDEAAALCGYAELSVFWACWNGLKSFFQSVWQVILKLLDKMMATVRSAVQRIRRRRFSHNGPGGSRIIIELEAVPYSRIQEQTEQPSPREIRRNLDNIHNKLSVFCDMWNVVDAACEDLIVDLGQAQGTITQPAPHEANLQSARSVYGVLIECMRAYAQNRPPVF
ncbi:uncharacterized protein LAESUDRAFT_356307 [Laetiporus sulphureus 93-53]|uniref:Uncharacterized protein n=1 Tax=Laetiporus sulphureus 93-53 TaxID=1314785 RepID=A0A165GWQ5_9APHY|nr:uncharacterized protein LAESUDRAFT_356307 [Laetiporus sulphureus 93-53]KZT10931.1 hypothetical protein LAESUDRAFT_356307 [Laetiporus sulphureus 93-53]